MGFNIAVQCSAFAVMLMYCLTEWHNYYIVLFYTPVIAVQTMYAVAAFFQYGDWVHQVPPNFFNLFFTSRYKAIASYAQWCIIVFCWIMLFNARTIFHVQESGGWGNSPCGASSCTRSDSLDLMNAEPYAVYNPRGWFPRGDHERYDELGTSRYVFCNYGDGCRWADYTGEPIRSYEKLMGGCELNYDAPVADEGGFASRRIQDYIDPGKGILNGWSPCKLVGQSYPCRGNKKQMTEPFNGTSRKHFKGNRVCAVCSLYQNTYKTLIGGAANGQPEFKDEDIECAPDPDYGINPWCPWVCPGETSHFGSPFNKYQFETNDKKDLLDIMYFSFALASFPLLSIVSLYVFMSKNILINIPTAQEIVPLRAPSSITTITPWMK